MTVSWIAGTPRALILALGLALTAGAAAAQPSAPIPDGMPESATPGAGPSTNDTLVPGDRGFRPQSPADEVKMREARLDTLFARLAEKDANWQRVQEEIWRTWTQSGSHSMDFLLKRADEAMQKGEAEEALRFLGDLVRLAPDFAEGWNKRATVHFSLGNYGQSLADIERTLALEPRHFGALTGLGMIFERSGDNPAAYEAYSRALEIHPNLEHASKAVERLRPEVEGREL